MEGAPETPKKRPKSWKVAALLAVIPVAGTIAVKLIDVGSGEKASAQTPDKTKAGAAEVGTSERRRAAFEAYDGALTRYLTVADDYAGAFARNGNAAFTSAVAEKEIGGFTHALNVAVPDLSERGQRYIGELQTAYPQNLVNVRRAEDLLNQVLRAVHREGVVPLNSAVNDINDARKRKASQVEIDALIDKNQPLVDQSCARIRTAVQQAQEGQARLQREFRELL